MNDRCRFEIPYVPESFQVLSFQSSLKPIQILLQSFNLALLPGPFERQLDRLKSASTLISLSGNLVDLDR